MLVYTSRRLLRSNRSQVLRAFSTHSNTRPYDAVVIGAGPGGLTAASNLMDQGLSNICMFDPYFTAGRIHEKYREVPSNTKTHMFEKWATGTKTFSQIIEAAPKPNAYTTMLSFDQDEGCMLGDAVNVAQLLSDGIRKVPGVDSVTARVRKLRRERDVWDLSEHGITSRKVVLTLGSHPKRFDLVDKYPHLKELDLDITLKPSALRETVPAGSKVGVIGASHSAVLALKNLYELGNVSIVNFHRSPLLYAEYKDGWILYDNTGLKGVAADWAREILAPENPNPRLRRINLKTDGRADKEIYDRELEDCTHLVSAIGYEMNALPTIEVDGQEVLADFDPLTGRFKEKESQRPLPGLYGAGIAYPERVTDRAGNVESAVGWFKFMRFCKRVAPEWAAEAP
ncbi:hypothetical protein LTS18_006307 [Coniosporium uncinatum]|uniref:Uncharacterized protein n=1 Tax=Coniosporium uncinatum TaxID=93489 RepID=A0ACC3DQB9_9PEZI|nr:hypothetical protein LTS18_006307 [Coniosporium uncinatum]